MATSQSLMGKLSFNLLIHGARAAIRFVEHKVALESGLCKRMVRHNKYVAVVALANKHARIIWTLLTKGTIFRLDHTSVACATTASSKWLNRNKFKEKGFHRLHRQS